MSFPFGQDLPATQLNAILYARVSSAEQAKAFPLINVVYPAAAKKFQHSSGVKRSQISPMAWMSGSKVLAPMRRR